MADQTNSNELISTSALQKENSTTNVVDSLDEVNNSDFLDSNIEENLVEPDEVTIEPVITSEETNIADIAISDETATAIDSEIGDSVDSKAELSEESESETSEEASEVASFSSGIVAMTRFNTARTLVTLACTFAITELMSTWSSSVQTS